MALDRKYQKIFGKNAEVTDLGVVGSKNAGSPDTSNDVEELQSLSNWETGLRAQVTSSEAPYLQDQNSIFYVITSQLAYLFQAGIAEWNAQTEYVANRSVVLKDGKIYIAIANSVGIEPEVTSSWRNYWQTKSSTVSSYYAYCSSGASDALKEITINDLVLVNGTKIIVKFGFGSYVAFSSTPTLRIHIGNQTTDLLIKVGHGSSNDTQYANFVCKNTGIVEFTYYQDGGTDYAYCDNVIAYETSSTSKWAKVYRNGWCEQSGLVIGENNVRTATATVTFLKEFVTTKYTFNFTGTRDDNSGNCAGATGTRDKKTTSIYISYYGNDESDKIKDIMWTASGFVNP